MTPEPDARHHDQAIIAEVDYLSEEVKSLALNLAIFLARAKTQAGTSQLTQLEPEFIRLVNGTVRAVNEITAILNAARNIDAMAFPIPSDSVHRDHLEVKLHGILEQCNQVLAALKQAKDIIA
jgi:hypothetical protein